MPGMRLRIEVVPAGVVHRNLSLRRIAVIHVIELDRLLESCADNRHTDNSRIAASRAAVLRSRQRQGREPGSTAVAMINPTINRAQEAC